MQENRIFLLLLTLIVLVGAVLRFWALGAQQLSSPELAFHFAARSVAQGSGPLLPSGEPMGRGRPMIQVIAALQTNLRDAESAARIPSAVLGTTALILFAGLTWLIAGPWAALVATFLFAFFPESIRQSRTAGLYSFQQLCGVIALGAGWLSTSHSVPAQKSTPTDLARRWVWAGLTGIAFALAGLAHLSAGTVLVGFGTWVLFLAAIAVWLNGPRAIVANLAAQLVIVGLLCAAAIFVVRPDVLGVIRDKISTADMSRSTVSLSPGFYVEAFASQFGWVFTLLPLIALVAFRKYSWLSVYLILWFAIPLVEHSLWIARKEERLVLMAAPALFFLAGLAVSEGREVFTRAINVHAREWLRSYRSAIRTSDQIVWAAIAFALITLPAVPISIRAATTENTRPKTQWAAVRRTFDEAANSGTLPFGTTEPLVAMQYAARSDFAIATGLVEMAREQVKARTAAPRFRTAKDSVAFEMQSGAVLVRDVASVRDAYMPYSEVHIALDSRDMNSPLIERGLLLAIQEQGTELCHGRCGFMRLYRLRLGDPPVVVPPPATPPPG